VSSWWADEARRYGVQFDEHDDRYARTAEWLDVIDGAWRSPRFDYAGKYYRVSELVLEPKPLRRPRPTIYAGGESEAAKSLISRACDAYVMHGDPPERIAEKIADMRKRREGFGLGPMIYGVAGYSIVRNTDAEAKAELARITAIRGAEILCRPSALLRSADLWELTNRARAYDNHVYVIGSNATGVDPAGTIYFGNSMIVTPILPVFPDGCRSRARLGPGQRAAIDLAGRGARHLVEEFDAPGNHEVLEEAIAAGGSTLRDFASPNGELGYFSKSFAVYDREGRPCGALRLYVVS